MDEIMSFVESLDPAQLLPDLGRLFSNLHTWIGIAMKAGPVVLLAVGLVYLLLPPKEANHIMGFRTPFGMGSVPAWKFTQRMAGAVWTGLGGILLIVALVKDGSLRELEPMEHVIGALWVLFGQAVSVAVAWLVMQIVPAVLFNWGGQARFRMPEKPEKAEKAPVFKAKKIGMKLWKRSEGPTRATEEKPAEMVSLEENPEIVPAELEDMQPEEPAEAPQTQEPDPAAGDEDAIFESIQRSVNREEE